METKFSDGTEKDQYVGEVETLLTHGWELDEEKIGLIKTYYFKTYTKCLDFSQVIGVRSKSKNHHSTMTIKTRSVQVHWTTHDPHGLSDKDIFMAKYCDKQAGEIGTVHEHSQGMDTSL